MSPPTVIWMRHGTCVDGLRRPGAHATATSPLHPQGETEVTTAATALRELALQPGLIVTSPLPRAAASADLVATILGIPSVEHHEALREWAAPTMVLGRTAEEYPPEYHAWRACRLRDVTTALPGGESLQAVHDRAGSARALVADLASRYGMVLAVSHLVLIGSVAAIHSGIDGPAQAFTFACGMPLAPAGLWCPEPQPDQTSQRSVAPGRV